MNCMEKTHHELPRAKPCAPVYAVPLMQESTGITLASRSASGFLRLMEDHPRFHEAKLGIIVSSLRALQLFSAQKCQNWSTTRCTIVVEGPLAGGHLGFGSIGRNTTCAPSSSKFNKYLQAEKLPYPSSRQAEFSPAAMPSASSKPVRQRFR